jgi:hypothetical protein
MGVIVVTADSRRERERGSVGFLFQGLRKWKNRVGGSLCPLYNLFYGQFPKMPFHLLLILVILHNYLSLISRVISP